MNLSRSGVISRAWAWTFGVKADSLPRNFCDFFWWGMFALIISPLTIPTIIHHKILCWVDDKEYDYTYWKWYGRVVVTIFTGFVAYLVGMIAYACLFHTKEAFTIFSVSLLITLTGVGIYKLWQRALKNSETDSEIEKTLREIKSVAVNKWHSVKEKNCPIIIWED